jgi:hypothetical protein
MEYNFTFQSYLKRESNMMLWLGPLSQVSEIEQLFREMNESIDSEIKDVLEKHHGLCQDCSIDGLLENYEVICSVKDVFELESVCIEEILDTDIKMSNILQQSYMHNFITALKTDEFFKKKVKLYQRISSMILYFMQFIPEYRKSTPCMRFIIRLAEKVVKMKI